MVRPTRDQTLHQIAEAMSWRSTCSRNAVGVVIAREGRILSTGYNGAPAGMPHCEHLCDCGGNSLDPSLHRPSCESMQPCKIAVHAEANAIAYAARFGVETQGADLFTTLSPCVACAQLIISAGIISVRYGREYRDRSGLTLLIQADIVVSE